MLRFRGGMSKETRLIVDSVEELYNQETPQPNSTSHSRVMYQGGTVGMKIYNATNAMAFPDK